MKYTSALPQKNCIPTKGAVFVAQAKTFLMLFYSAAFLHGQSNSLAIFLLTLNALASCRSGKSWSNKFPATFSCNTVMHLGTAPLNRLHQLTSMEMVLREMLKRTSVVSHSELLILGEKNIINY